VSISSRPLAAHDRLIAVRGHFTHQARYAQLIAAALGRE
jgi:hypothetical protein